MVSRRASILYSYASNYVDDSTYMDGVESKGVYDPEQVNSVYPINPLTGLPDTDGGKVADPSLTHYEREKVMSRLAGMSEGRGSYLPSNLSDEEVLSLVPPRYVQDAVDVQRWRDYLSVEVIPYMSDDVKNIADSDEVEETKEETDKEE